MKMVQSSTTAETFSDAANMVFWHKEVLNTTHFVNLDHSESSERECEARMSTDIQEMGTQHYGLGIEERTQIRQESINCNEQIENMENLTPELLNHFMEKHNAQASQIWHLSGNKSLLDHETEKAVNISGHDTSNIKAKVWQHHSSQTFIECSFPGSHVVRNEGLNRSESNEVVRGATSLTESEATKMTELDRDTVNINNDKLMMDADMDFTDVILINKTNGSYTSDVNNAMDLTKGNFCRGTNSNSDGAQGYVDLDESEIELTNTVGHIVASESEDTFSRISEINMLGCDSGRISDSSNGQEAATNYVHKINTRHLQPSNATMQSTVKLPSGVDSNTIHKMSATILEEKKYLLDTSQMHQCEKKKEDFNDCHAEFIDDKDSRANKMNEHNSTAKISDDSHLELTDVVQCISPTKDIDDSHLELTNVAVYKPILLADNTSRNVQINNDPANDSQLELTDMIPCKSVAKVSNNDMEFTNTAGFKIPAKVNDDSHQELTEVSDYGNDAKLYDINLEHKNSSSGKLTSSEEVNCGSHHIFHENLTENTNFKSVPEVSDYRLEQSSKLVSYSPLTDTVARVWAEFTLESCDDSHLEFTNVAAYKPAEIAGISFSKETDCLDSEQTNECPLELSGLKSSDSSLEYTKIVKHKSFTEDPNNSGLEFTNIMGKNQLIKNTESSQQIITDLVQNLHAKDSDDSQLEFTNVTGQKLLGKYTEASDLGITDINGQNLKFANFTMQNLSAKVSDSSQLEFTNTGPKLPAEDSHNNLLEFTNVVGHKQAAKVIDVSQMEITDIMSRNQAPKHSDSSQLELTIAGPNLPVEDSNNDLLEFTNVVGHKQAAKVIDVSQMEITDIISWNRAPKHSDSSQLELTKAGPKLPAEDSHNLLEFTNVVSRKQAAKVTDVSQMEITDILSQKQAPKHSDSSQLELTKAGPKLPAEDSHNDLLEFTNVSHKQAAKVTDVSQMEITDIISKKWATKYPDGSQLESTNLTMQKASTNDFDDSQLEFTNNTRQKLPAKGSDNSQIMFTNSAVHKPLDSQLDFDDSAKHKLAAKYTDVSKLEFTNIAGHKLFTKDIEISQPDITNITMQNLYAKDFDDSHLGLINNASQKLPVKNSVDSQLEFINNTNNKSFANDSDGQQEVINIIADKLLAKDSDEFTDNTRQNMLKDDSDDCMDFTNKTSQKFIEKDFDVSQMQFTNINRQRLPEKCSDVSGLEFTNIIGHNTETKNSDRNQLEFTDTAERIPSIKNSVEFELESTCKHATNVFDANNSSKEVEAIHLEHTPDFLKIPNKECEIEGNYYQTDSQILSLSVSSLGPASESCDEICINRETIDNTSDLNVDGVVVINSDGSRKMLHTKEDSNNESISQQKLTEIASLKTTANISINLSCSKATEELNQFSLRATNGSQLELTNVVGIGPTGETVVIGTESAKAVDKCIESTVIMDITNAIQCRKNPKSQIELAESHSVNSAKCPYVERKENVDMSIDINELGSNLSGSRKRNSSDLHCDHYNGCELECSNMKYFRLAERADAQVTRTEISETTSCESFIEKHLELTPRTELKQVSPQHIDNVTPDHANCSEKDVTNTVNCGTIKTSSGCISLAFGVPSTILDECKNDSMEFTNKQNSVLQMSDSLEFTAGVKDVNDISKDNLLQEKPLKGLETDDSEQEVSLTSNLPQSSTTPNIHQDDSTHDVAVTDLNSSPKEDIVRNEALPLTPNRKVQKKMQAAQNLLNVTIRSDEAFMFETCTGTFVPVNKLRMSKQLEYFDKTDSYPSSPERMQLDTDSENASYKAKENQKQNIEHMQIKEHMLLEDESITFIDDSSHSFEREDEADDSMIKKVLDADRSLFSSLSTVSPGTVFSSSSESPAAANAKEHLVEEMHPNQEKNKESMPSNEPEMMSEVEGNFVDGKSPKIQLLKQPSSISETKMEICNVSVDMDCLSISDKDLSSVEQAEVYMSLSNNSEETKEKFVDIEASDKEKGTVQPPNITLAHMELYCIESVVHDKTEEFRTAAVLNVGQSCVPVQKPLTLEEWLKSGKHEWDVKELGDTQWKFLFLYKSLGLVLKLDAANVKDGMKYISDILLESYLAKRSAPETHFVHHILLKKLSSQNLKTKFKVTADVPELMDIISKAVVEIKLFLRDFFFMETCKLMEMKDNRVSFKMSDMLIHSVFRVSVDLSNWESIEPEDVTVEDLMGTINKKEVQNLVNAVPKGPTFLSEYVDIIREYILVLRKK